MVSQYRVSKLPKTSSSFRVLFRKWFTRMMYKPQWDIPPPPPPLGNTHHIVLTLFQQRIENRELNGSECLPNSPVYNRMSTRSTSTIDTIIQAHTHTHTHTHILVRGFNRGYAHFECKKPITQKLSIIFMISRYLIKFLMEVERSFNLLIKSWFVS